MASEFIFGIHAVTTALKRNPESVLAIYCLSKAKGSENQRVAQAADLAHGHGVRISWLDKDAFEKKIASDGVHQGIAAEVKPLKQFNEDKLAQILQYKAHPFLLILDGVTDPHNLGACLRSADAAGVDAVIVPKDRSVSLNATVRKVACGAAEVVPLIPVTNLKRTIKDIQSKGVWVTGLAGEATQSLYELDLKGPVCIVMGAEGDGMRRLTKEACDYLAFLPMAGEVSSLNVSVATGITLFEAVRQRS